MNGGHSGTRHLGNRTSTHQETDWEALNCTRSQSDCLVRGLARTWKKYRLIVSLAGAEAILSNNAYVHLWYHNIYYYY